MQNRANVTVSGNVLAPEDEANPCGLLARNYPMDRYISLELEDESSDPIAINRTGDKLMIEDNVKFVFDGETMWTDTTDPLFYNWMVSEK